MLSPRSALERQTPATARRHLVKLSAAASALRVGSRERVMKELVPRALELARLAQEP